MERIITKSFARLMGRGTHRGFITYEELSKSLGKRNLSDENLSQAFIHILNENIKLFTEYNKKIFEMIIEKLKSGSQITIQDLDLDVQLTEKINKFAPIKHILKNQSDDDQKIIEILEDISRDLMNYDLELRIQELESKFSVDMSESTFNELKELKKKQNIN